MDDDIRDDIGEAMQDVADDATPETNTEAVEQREDDYQGLARRLDDVLDMLRTRFDSIDARLDALGTLATDAGIAPNDTIDASDVADEMADVIDEILGIDALDLL